MELNRPPHDKDIEPDAGEPQDENPSQPEQQGAQPQLAESTPPVDRESVDHNAVADEASFAVEQSDVSKVPAREVQETPDGPDDATDVAAPDGSPDAQTAPAVKLISGEGAEPSIQDSLLHAAPPPVIVESGVETRTTDFAAPVWNGAGFESPIDPGEGAVDDAFAPWAQSVAERSAATSLPSSELPDFTGVHTSDKTARGDGPSNTPESGHATAQGGWQEIPVVRPGDPARLEQLPFIYSQHADRPLLADLADSEDTRPSDHSDPPSSNADLSPRTQAMLSPTSDGGPPLARPIVLVSLSDAKLARIKEEALAAAAARDEASLDRIAEAKVDHAFWVKSCHERAVYGNY